MWATPPPPPASVPVASSGSAALMSGHSGHARGAQGGRIIPASRRHARRYFLKFLNGRKFRFELRFVTGRRIKGKKLARVRAAPRRVPAGPSCVLQPLTVRHTVKLVNPAPSCAMDDGDGEGLAGASRARLFANSNRRWARRLAMTAAPTTRARRRAVLVRQSTTPISSSRAAT